MNLRLPTIPEETSKNGDNEMATKQALWVYALMQSWVIIPSHDECSRNQDGLPSGFVDPDYSGNRGNKHPTYMVKR